MRIAFEGVERPVEVPEDREFLNALQAAALDWRFAPANSAGEPVAVIRKAEQEFEILTPEGDVIDASAVSAACSAVVDVLRSYVDENPEQLCLHAAAVEFAGRLAVFPSRFRAGKSTLVAELARAGHRVFGDDVLPLIENDTCGLALGLAPRLRIPLPASAPPALRDFAAKHASVADDRYSYLKLPAAVFAQRGQRAPLGAVVLLDRRTEGPARLFRASRAAALQTLVVQNFARSAPADDLLERLHRLMDRLPCLTLRYCNLDDARVLLEGAFAEWPPAIGTLEEGDPFNVLSGDEDVEDTDLPTVALPADAKLRQNPRVRLREVDGALFLTDAEGFGIHHLNAIGAGVWRLMVEPLSQSEAVDVLASAFPETDRRRIEQDVKELFSALIAEGFAEPAELDVNCQGRPRSA